MQHDSLRSFNTTKTLLTLFCLSPMLALAGPLDALPDSPHPDATLPNMANKVDSGLGIAYKLILGFGVVVGLWMVYVGLSRLKKISNDEINGSAWSAIAILFIGGMMASAGVWLFTFAKTAQDLSGSSAPL